MLIYWTIFLGILLWIYSYIRSKQSFWNKYNLPIPDSHKFLLGSEWELALNSWPEIFTKRLKKYGKLFGSYQILRPVLYCYDPDLIKLIMIKDFHCFTDRLRIRTYHELLNQNLFFSEGQQWKRMRTIASPSFTSKKLRNISKMMNNCIGKLFQYFDKTLQQPNNNNNNVIQTKKVIAGFTMDVIAWCGFSTETNSNDDRKEDNQFLKNGLGLFQISTFRAIAANSFPRPLLNLLNIRTANNPECFDYFINLTKEIIRQRKLRDSKSTSTTIENKPQDLLQLMLDAECDEIELQNDNFNKLTASIDETETTESSSSTMEIKNRQKLTEAEVIANSIIFLVAGFETTSSTISHCLFQLAWNQEIQQQLFEELHKVLDGKSIDSDQFYDAVMHGIPYLEACIKETLRLYPPVSVLTRTVTCNEYRLKNLLLPKGTLVFIPTHAIHHCEDYYSEPEKFQPERFMPENRDKLIPYTWMPFGLGPRNCIGMRFAYQEIRLTLARMLMRYRFETTGNTPKKLEFGPRSPILLTSQFELAIFKR